MCTQIMLNYTLKPELFTLYEKYSFLKLLMRLRLDVTANLQCHLTRLRSTVEGLESWISAQEH